MLYTQVDNLESVGDVKLYPKKRGHSENTYQIHVQRHCPKLSRTTYHALSRHNSCRNQPYFGLELLGAMLPPIPLPQRQGRVKTNEKVLNINYEGSLVSLVAVADTVWNGGEGGAPPPAKTNVIKRPIK